MAAFLLADAAGQPPALGRQVAVTGCGRRPRRTRSAPRPASGCPWWACEGRRLPPVRLLPGQRPAQEARWPAVGNTLMSAPISAMIVSSQPHRLPTAKRPRHGSIRRPGPLRGSGAAAPYGALRAIDASARPRRCRLGAIRGGHLKPSVGCADLLTAGSFCLSMTLDRIGVG
jgi:hypothetical protein